VNFFFGAAPPKHVALNNTSSLFLVFGTFSSLESFCVAFFFSLFFMSRMYMLFDILVAVATNLPELFSLILHFRESNVSLNPPQKEVIERMVDFIQFWSIQKTQLVQNAPRSIFNIQF
jgi:hypothetical protein